ncbi:zinc finger matrin-type protein 1 [Spinachia spinachia]
MDDRSVCTPLLAESDTQNTTASSHNAASVTNADKVTNTKIDSTQFEGDELLEGLITDDYCHVCEAVLLFESQRLSHYEGKKHAQKVKVYLQAKRAEEMDIESTGLQRTMTTDKDHFCELCKMVFSSHVVAKSHYEGKVHAKNLRKQGPHLPVADMNLEVHSFPSLIREQKSAPHSHMEHLLDPAAAPSAGIDLKDPNKYCAMCAVSFNNPQMALQHYNGRKHQRKRARQDLLKELGNDDQKANSLTCQMCRVQFNSVEMYLAHMQGNKHQIREKKIVDLCKSQQKDYNTFADELKDYVQVQKARGITPKAGQVLPAGDLRTEGKEGYKEEEAFYTGDISELKRLPHLPPTANPPHHSRLGGYYPVAGWRPPYHGPAWPSHHWDYSFPPPVPAGTGSPLFTNPSTNRRRRRRESSSSSCTTLSSYSSYSSSTSDSDVSEYRRREKRRTRTSGREGDRRARDENSDREKKRSKRQRMERDVASEERTREESGEFEEEGRRKSRKTHSKQRKRENKCRGEDFEVEGGKRVTDNLTRENAMLSRKETEVHIKAEMNVEQRESELDPPAKAKYRKEKNKIKMKADTRSEEEKLWDDSILGC